jgi:ABC-type multidrug transport system fused ATPase/permease subunit
MKKKNVPNAVNEEKLKLLLNKVVELNRPDVIYCKGFLYKEGDLYYLKVVEGSNRFYVNSKYYLNDGDADYIVHAEKPKLMRVSLKSWHYRLVKRVLGDNAPTPKNMQNGCPYFWLLLFSMIAYPIILLINAIGYVAMLIPRAFTWYLDKLADSWLIELPDEEAFDIYYRGKKSAYIPLSAKVSFRSGNDTEFLQKYVESKYHIDYATDYDLYKKKYDEMVEKWRIKDAEREERERIKRKERIDRLAELEMKRMEHARIREEYRQKWEARLKPVTIVMSSIRKIFTFNKDWKNIIRRTKQFIGAIITLFVLAVSYVFVNGLTFVTMLLVDGCINNWEFIAGFGVGALIAGVLYLLYMVIMNWVQNLVNKYRKGKKIWYVEPFIYLVWYPVKYIAMSIGYVVLYLLILPIKFIAYDFLYKIIGLFVWKVLKSIWHVLVESTGIFGEYFSASYTDYCPGIEWVDTEE